MKNKIVWLRTIINDKTKKTCFTMQKYYMGTYNILNIAYTKISYEQKYIKGFIKGDH